MFRCFLVLGLITPALAPARADDPGLVRFVDEQTLLVGSLDISKAGLDAIVAKFQHVRPLGKEQAAHWRERIARLQQTLRQAGVSMVYFQLSATEASAPPTVMIPLRDASHVEQLKAVLPSGPLLEGGPPPRYAWEVIDGHLIGGLPASRERLRSLKPAARTDLHAALQGTTQGALQIYFIPSKDSRRVWEELVPTLPKELGGGSIHLLTRELQWASLSAELSPKLTGQVVVQMTGAAPATAMRDLWQAVLITLQREVRDPGSLPQLLVTLAQQLPVQVQGNQLIVRPEPELMDKVVTTFTQNIARASGETLTSRQLRDVAIAMHNYHTDYQKLPSQAIRSKDGQPLLSWRVALLPYLGEADLYKEFKLDEPWDSEHNKKLLARMPSFYRHPSLPDQPADQTYFQVFYSMKAMKPGAMLLQDGHTTLGQLTVQDGTSNTMFLTDAAATPVPWTKPDDLLFDPAQPLPKLASPTKTAYARAAFGDGSVRPFRIDADPKLLRQLIGRNDGLNADTTPVFK